MCARHDAFVTRTDDFRLRQLTFEWKDFQSQTVPRSAVFASTSAVVNSFSDLCSSPLSLQSTTMQTAAVKLQDATAEPLISGKRKFKIQPAEATWELTRFISGQRSEPIDGGLYRVTVHLIPAATVNETVKTKQMTRDYPRLGKALIVPARAARRRSSQRQMTSPTTASMHRKSAGRVPHEDHTRFSN
jgi:hypothetical protein